MTESLDKNDNEELRNITIYGLISFYGTERAKKCAMYLYKKLPKLYKRPDINVYYDYEWVEVVKQLQEKYGSKYRRLKYLKHPVIIFFNDRYIGDHRAIIHYVITEHRILPDLPFPNLFPDFTDLLPKNDAKTYVYFDLRVGDLDDYVVGKMVFELHADLVPETCNFFANLCKPFDEPAYGVNEKKWKYSYLGSTIHRISGRSFIQGGKIVGCALQVKDENFYVKHKHRGVLSLCNQGGNNSTTEFCICLKENKWLDGEVIAFGQLIFGEPILAAIQEIPTYYERPLKDIIIVGCGVIPKYADRLDHGFISGIEKQKELINNEVQKLRKKRIADIEQFEQKVKAFLNKSETEKTVEYTYLEDPRDSSVHLKTSRIPDEDLGEYLEEYLFEEEYEHEEKPVELTLDYILKRKKANNAKNMTNMMSLFIDIIVDNMDYASGSEKTDPLDVIPKKEIFDAVDVRDVPSEELVQERFEAGLYSIPESIRKLLVETFEKLTPSQLKMMGHEARGLLTKAGVSESTLEIMGSENVISGIVLAIVDVLSLREGSKIVQQVLAEIYEDAIKILQQKGTDVARNMLGPPLTKAMLGSMSNSTAL